MNGRKSLFLRILLVTVALLLAPSLLSFVLFFRTVPSRMEAQAEANTDFYVRQTVLSLEDSMITTTDMVYSLLGNDGLQASMRQTDQPLVSSGRSSLEQVVGSVAALRTAWNRYALSCVYLFRNDGQFIYYSPGGSFAEQQRRLQSAYEQNAEHSTSQTLYPVEDSGEWLYLLMDYKNINNMDLLGKLVVELNARKLLGSAELLQLYPEAGLVLANADGQVLFSVGAVPDEAAGTQQDDRSGYYHASRRIGEYKLWLDVFIPTTSIYNSVWETSDIYAASCLFILALTILAGIIASRALAVPIRRMTDTLSRMAASDYTARMPKSRYKELEKLESVFNQMADNLDASFQDAYQKGVQLQESESRLLAAQINPHFIFNVLESINMRCVDAGMKDISRMVTDLAQLLRGNIGIGNGNQKITFRQELNYVHYYLDLQQERFGGSLHWSVEYEDDDILDYLLPRLTIQPLVENAIVHGLEPRRGLGNVTVRLWEEGPSVYVRVTDDGVGFDAASLDLAAEAENAPTHNHIALPNILRRLRLLYGSEAKLELRSQAGKGTEALLVIPIDRKEE